ncbi:hypothetical protein RJ639_008017 [Escallonia herrerae]|uniref:High mobility group B protein 11 n=1 Tax=Escallonia herrerae TaxID=1293975 RepID=A0AA89ARQ2_9ASTE|nr:hypothetical protein RJ639_008017 [Escallonia herrerae]
MQPENENSRPDAETDDRDVSDVSDPNACRSLAASGCKPATGTESFYEKLSKMNEPSGLSLIFNFRETSLDLYLLYKDVTKRGGYFQVTRDGSWEEVASALNLNSSVSMSPTQLQKLYANLLYQFEQTYYYRSPAKLTEAQGHSSSVKNCSSCSKGKRKHSESSLHLSTTHSGPAKKECNFNAIHLSTVHKPDEKKLPLHASPKVKDTKKGPGAPSGARTSYQIFIRRECERLKGMLGERSAGQFRNMAIDAWNRLSESDRQPYIEESRKDRERYKQEMTAYTERSDLYTVSNCTEPNMINFAMPLQTDGDYHVTLEPDAENFFASDGSTVELAVKYMKDARPNDPIFQINWDEYCGSLDLPT